MFEALTREESVNLRAHLATAYQDSRKFSQWLSPIARQLRSAEARNGMYCELNAQAGMRAEITSLLWQLRHETAQ